MAGTVIESFGPVQITSSQNVAAGPACLGGIFCSSSTSGTATVYDDPSTGTTTKIVDTFGLSAGQFYPLPFSAKSGVNVVIGGTASITVGVVRMA